MVLYPHKADLRLSKLITGRKRKPFSSKNDKPINFRYKTTSPESLSGSSQVKNNSYLILTVPQSFLITPPGALHLFFPSFNEKKGPSLSNPWACSFIL